MENFKEAHRFFNVYQKSGGFHHLRASLDMLNEIIVSNGIESIKATNFKNTILRHLENQLHGIFIKCNIQDFAKDLKDIDDQELLVDRLATVLSASFSKEDGATFIELLNIKSEYFKQAPHKNNK